MLRGFYNQPDGGQVNVAVEMVNSSTDGWAVIRGRDLIGTFTDANGLGYLIIGEGFTADPVA